MRHVAVHRFAALVAAVLLLGLVPGIARAGALLSVDGSRSRERLLKASSEPAGVTTAVRRTPRAVTRDLPDVPALGPGESLLAPLERSMPVTSRPGAGRTIATMPSTSRYYGEPLVVWVQDVSSDGRFGLVSVPYVAGSPTGWIALRTLELSTTDVAVEADRSSHELVVRRDGDVILRTAAATGAAASPTPTGTYEVTDRVAFPGGGAFGTFAFGISGIQPNLPPGWDGGDQLAIHGTDDPSSIGTSASAGCLRVSERVLERLRPLLRAGTPVVIVP
jgi:lipoprotein-anchoring transpeptidase ErfK/SrfK